MSRGAGIAPGVFVLSNKIPLLGSMAMKAFRAVSVWNERQLILLVTLKSLRAFGNA